MKTDLEKAKKLLNGGDYTCVLCRGDTVYTGTERGVKPLVDWLNKKVDLRGFSAADKVVGKAAAFLYVLLGVTDLYAGVMSEPANDILIQNGIDCVFDKSAKAILNRSNTGFCPMETAVRDIDDPNEALIVIKNTLVQLQDNADKYAIK